MESFDGGAFEALGEWQFAGESTVYVGVLNFSPTDGLELRVVNPTGKHGMEAFFEAEPARKRICASGRTRGHGHVSLFDGFLRSKPSSSHGPAEAVYFFNRGLLGLATPDGNEQTFSSVFATGDLLRVWLDQKIVEFDPSTDSCVTVRHTLPKPLTTRLDAGKALTIGWDRHGPGLSLAQSSVAIQSRPWIGIEFDEPQRINRALTELDTSTRLVSLLSGFELRPSLVELRIPSNSTYRAPVYFLASRMGVAERSCERSPMDLLFTLPSLSARFNDLAATWFNFQGNALGCMNVFFSANYSAYTNQKLFALTSALEALHRLIIDPQRRTLRDRIKESLDRIPNLIPEIVGDRNAFAAKLVAYRNSEAHCSEADDGGSGSSYFRLASKLRAIIDAMIMLEIGLTLPEISSAMRKSREYWFYASNDSWPWNVAE